MQLQTKKNFKVLFILVLYSTSFLNLEETEYIVTGVKHCDECNQYWQGKTKGRDLKRHVCTKGQSKEVCKTGYYDPTMMYPNIFDTIENAGLHIPDRSVLYKNYLVCCDTESTLSDDILKSNEEFANTTYLQTHSTGLISLASNIKNKRKVFLQRNNENSTQFVERWIQYLLKLQRLSYQLYIEHPPVKQLISHIRLLIDTANDDYDRRRFLGLYNKLERYASVLLIFFFNGSKGRFYYIYYFNKTLFYLHNHSHYWYYKYSPFSPSMISFYFDKGV